MADDLIKAVEIGDSTKAEEIILQGFAVDETNASGETALMIAAMKGNMALVKLLLDKGADVNKQSQVGWNALCFAATRNHYEVVDVLIAAGADVNAICQNDCTILEWVIRQQDNRKYMVKQLLERGAEIRPRSLQIAKNNGEDEIFDNLLARTTGSATAPGDSASVKSDPKKPWWKLW